MEETRACRRPEQQDRGSLQRRGSLLRHQTSCWLGQLSSLWGELSSHQVPLCTEELDRHHKVRTVAAGLGQQKAAMFQEQGRTLFWDAKSVGASLRSPPRLGSPTRPSLRRLGCVMPPSLPCARVISHC